MPEETRKIFVNVFSRLKQRVLWKWPKEMPDRPPNVMLSKWIPQQDVLGKLIFLTMDRVREAKYLIYIILQLIPIFGCS